jgi:hypothetical protein
MRVLGAPSLSTLLAALCFATGGCTWLSHLTNFGLQRELTERSKGGLAVAAFYYDAIGVRFFDGRQAEVKLACCKAPLASVFARNRIVMVDAPVDMFGALASGFYGGPVVVMGTHGAVVERSELEIQADTVSLYRMKRRLPSSDPRVKDRSATGASSSPNSTASMRGK